MRDFTAIAFFCFLWWPSFAQVTVQDSLALAAFYYSTGGDNWTNNENWLTGQPVGTWYGITVSGDRVDALDLYGNNLTGTLPGETGMLTSLRRLDVSNNHLVGEIPTSIGQLTQLQQLSIYANAFEGSFPSTVGSCQALREVIAYTNSFSGPFPEALLMIQGLERIEIGSNQFNGEIPQAINNLTQLRRLGLDQNNFSGVMPSLKNLDAMVEMHLRYNQLSGDIRDFMDYMPNLYYLTLSGNNFTGNVSDTFFNPQRIQFIDVQENDFNALGDFSDFGETGVLSRLNVYGNAIPFQYLEPNRNIGQFAYTSQQGLLDSLYVTLSTGESLSMQAGSGGLFTNYQWYQNEEIIPGAIESSYTIAEFNAAQEGVYNCVMTNDSLPLLILERNPVIVDGLMTGTREPEAHFLTLYPNPAGQILYLSEATVLKEIVVSDLSGKVFRVLPVESNSIDISSLPAGHFQLAGMIDGLRRIGAFVKYAD